MVAIPNVSACRQAQDPGDVTKLGIIVSILTMIFRIIGSQAIYWK